MRHIVIIGNGIAGITAARNIRKYSNDSITVISAESDYFFSRTALMYIFMGHMKFEHTKPYEDYFWKKNKIELINDYVEKVDTDSKKLHFKSGDALGYDILIIACGSKFNKFGWPGQDLKGVSGMYSKQDLENIQKYSADTKKAVITGGGLIGIEVTEMLLSKNIEVTFLVREPSFWNKILPPGESEIVNKLLREHNVDLRLNTELKEIIGNENGRVKSIITNTGEEIPCQFVGLTAGVSPNIDFLKESKIEIQRGVLVNEYLETNIPDVYAIGDCVQHSNPPGLRRPVEQVWYTGRIMGETIAKTLCRGRTAYRPGHWFNSAKFFEVEYQTYGWVWATLKDNEADYYWENEEKTQCLHFVYDKSSQALLGVNSFGIRLRHEVMDKWLTEGKDIMYVIDNLKEAWFEPELYKKLNINLQ